MPAKIFRLSFLFVIGFLAFSCKKKSDEPTAYQTTLNVQYGPDAAQSMDVYLPVSRSSNVTKSIVLIHGGGWNSMDKSDFNRAVDTFKKRLPDYALFNLNYRLAKGNANLFPTQENDINTAIEFINSKLGEYGISNKFVFLGGSAGAHLALLQGYKYTSVIKPRVIVDFFGPTDLKDMYDNPGIPIVGSQALVAVIGGTPTQLPALYQNSSPLNFITASSTPTIILQGGADVLVLPRQAERLRDKLQQSGITYQYVYYPTEAHGWEGANLYDSFNKIEPFIRAHIN
jgi:acetyl esterase/lipase